MDVPHSVVLRECSDVLIVADRENSRVCQFDLASRSLKGAPVTSTIILQSYQ